MHQGIALALDLKFSSVGQGLLGIIDDLRDTARLQTALDAIRNTERPEDLARELAEG